MQLVYKVVLLALLAFMLRSPLLRLQQTATHLIKTTAPAASRTFTSTSTVQNDTMSDDRPSGLIAKKGLELLTFGTPNGKSSVAADMESNR